MVQVSIIIPCYNASLWLRETLASAFAQQAPLAQAIAQEGELLQVIVVDDGSTDDSAAIVEREFPHAELVRTENCGPGAARNRGLEMARGEWIQFLDADDVLCPGKIAIQRAALLENQADIAYSDWQYLVRGTDGAFSLDRIVANQIHGIPEIAIFSGFWAPTCAYLFRRRIVDVIGGFNVTLPILQDAHFVLDGALHTARFLYVPGVSSYYRIHAAQISRNRVAFARDSLKQTTIVQRRWLAHGGLTQERRAALLRVLANLARTSYAMDRATFWEAYRSLEQLSPHYIPAEPTGLRHLARLFGYPRAEEIALRYRQIKRGALGLVGRTPPEPIHSNVPRT